MIIESLIDDFLEICIPSSYRYFLWSAESNQSLFDFSLEAIKPKKNQKYLIYESKQKIEQELNHIWSLLNCTACEQEILTRIQPLLIASKKTVKNKLQNFLNAKDELLREISTLGNLIDRELLQKFHEIDIAKILLWIESNKFEKKFSIASLFNMKSCKMDSHLGRFD